MSEFVDRALIFKDDLLEAASKTLSNVAKQHDNKKETLKKKSSTTGKDKNRTVSNKDTPTLKNNKPKRKKAKLEYDTVFVGIHSR